MVPDASEKLTDEKVVIVEKMVNIEQSQQSKQLQHQMSDSANDYKDISNESDDGIDSGKLEITEYSSDNEEDPEQPGVWIKGASLDPDVKIKDHL